MTISLECTSLATGRMQIFLQDLTWGVKCGSKNNKIKQKERKERPKNITHSKKADKKVNKWEKKWETEKNRGGYSKKKRQFSNLHCWIPKEYHFTSKQKEILGGKTSALKCYNFSIMKWKEGWGENRSIPHFRSFIGHSFISPAYWSQFYQIISLCTASAPPALHT